MVVRRLMQRCAASSAQQERKRTPSPIHGEAAARDHERRHARGYFEGYGDESCAQCPPEW